MGGGSDLTLAAPFPLDPLDPLDPVMNSKSDVFIVRVVTLDQNGALALCFFFMNRAENLTCLEKKCSDHRLGDLLVQS